MKHVLARRNRAVLEDLARHNALLAFDYDGTLAPIVRDPARARIRARTSRLLAELARVYPCVLLSGRARRDLAWRVRGVPFALVVGNHGAEWPRAARDPVLERRVKAWRASLERQLAAVDGVVVEDKGRSLAVHYRRARRKNTARALIARALASLRDARVAEGKQVFDVQPVGSPHKGHALVRLWQALRAEAGIFVGDDATDEDAFRPSRKLQGLLTIRVGWRRTSRAAYYLRDQREVDDLLSFLLEARGKAR